MARPRKPGLDYFPLDVSTLGDAKLIAARRKYGYLATIVYLQLLCITYRDKGYYIEYDKDTKDVVISQILSESLIGKYQPDYNTIEDVINELVACRLFSHDLYQLGFLTSLRIQETYYKATIDRKSVLVDDKIWMLNQESMQRMSTRHSLLSKIVNRPNNPVNQRNNEVNQSNNTQSKEKESKEKESKGNEKERMAFPQTVETFAYLFGRSPDESFLQSLETLGKTDDECAEAMLSAKNKNPEVPEAYMLVVIRSYKPEETMAQKLGIGQQEPIGKLQDWEIEQLREIKEWEEKHK